MITKKNKRKTINPQLNISMKGGYRNIRPERMLQSVFFSISIIITKEETENNLFSQTNFSVERILNCSQHKARRGRTKKKENHESMKKN